MNYQWRGRSSAKKLQNAYKLSCSELDSDDMHNSVVEPIPIFELNRSIPFFKSILDKNEKQEQNWKDKKVHRLRKAIEKPGNVYKWFSSISELNFLDVLLLQIDRHDGNYYYNAVSVKGIDDVMSQILAQYDLFKIEKFISTNDGKNIDEYYLSKNVFENPILEISMNYKGQNLA